MNYAQEIGRAGRDGRPSVCEMFYCPDDLNVLENFVYGDTPSRNPSRVGARDFFATRRISTRANTVIEAHDIRINRGSHAVDLSGAAGPC